MLKRTVLADAHGASRLRRELRQWLRVRGVRCELGDDVVLAATEAMANVVDHAYRGDHEGSVKLTAMLRPWCVVVTVSDAGVWDHTPPEASRGRGLALIHALTPGVAISATATGTTVRLTWPAPTTAEADGGAA